MWHLNKISNFPDQDGNIVERNAPNQRTSELWEPFHAELPTDLRAAATPTWEIFFMYHGSCSVGYFYLLFLFKLSAQSGLGWGITVLLNERIIEYIVKWRIIEWIAGQMNFSFFFLPIFY